jgi:hypothetical protein
MELLKEMNSINKEFEECGISKIQESSKCNSSLPNSPVIETITTMENKTCGASEMQAPLTTQSSSSQSISAVIETETTMGKKTDGAREIQAPLSTQTPSTHSISTTLPVSENNLTKRGLTKERQKARLKLIKKTVPESTSPERLLETPPRAPDPPPRQFETESDKFLSTKVPPCRTPLSALKLNSDCTSDQKAPLALTPSIAPDLPSRLDLINQTPKPHRPTSLGLSFEKVPPSPQPVAPEDTPSPDDQLTESEKIFYDELARTEVVKASMTGAEITRLLRDRRMSKMSNITEMDEYTSSLMSMLPEDQASSLEELNDSDLTPPKLPPTSQLSEKLPENGEQDLSRSFTTSNFNIKSYNVQFSEPRVRCDSADSFVLHEEELKRQEAHRRQETLRALNQRLDTIREEFVVPDRPGESAETGRRNMGLITGEIERMVSESDVSGAETPVMKPVFDEEHGEKMENSNFRHVFRIKHREKFKGLYGDTVQKRQIEALKDLQREVGSDSTIDFSLTFHFDTFYDIK